MCGRLNITDDPFAKAVSDILGIPFALTPNRDLRPTEKVSVIGGVNGVMTQKDLIWGIKPSWSKRIIINAQAETVAIKQTFSVAYHSNRVVVPCAGWYEWKGEKGNKQKYLFSALDDMPLFMAGIALDKKLVTLTTRPNEQCAKYHHRMPLLIPDDAIERWLNGNVAYLDSLLHAENARHFHIERSILP